MFDGEPGKFFEVGSGQTGKMTIFWSDFCQDSEVQGSIPTLPGLFADAVPGKPDKHEGPLNFPATHTHPHIPLTYLMLTY